MFSQDKMQKYIDFIGLKQNFIANKAGMSEKALSYILSGKRKCGIDEYAKYVWFLGFLLTHF